MLCSCMDLSGLSPKICTQKKSLLWNCRFGETSGGRLPLQSTWFLDSTLESRGSQSVDEILSDFSALTVSHDTSGLATTGVQEGQSSRYCKGKHPPSNRFKHSHSHEDRPTAVISPMQSVETPLEADRVELTLPAVHNLSAVTMPTQLWTGRKSV